MFNFPNSYLACIRQWLENGCEVFLIARFMRAAGLRAYGFLRDDCDLQKALAELPVGTELIAFRNPQLPLRSGVDSCFIETVLESISEGEEYLVVDLSARKLGGTLCDGRMGDSHADLRADLELLVGRFVAVGICPPFTSNDNDEMISASVGGVNGPR